MPSLQIPEKLKPLLRPKQIKVVYGGRGSAKSRTFADLFLMLAETGGHKIGCFRELQNSIKDSVHSLLVDRYRDMKLSLYSHTETGIKHKNGGEFIFKGLSRNPDAVKSTHGMTRAWVEEAQSVSDSSLKQLIPTVREPGSELWFSLNPMSSEDPMSKRFLKPFEAELTKNGYYEDDMHMIIECNYMDNPFFPPELDNLRLWDYENLDRAEYDHIWLGKYNDHIENSIIKAEWFDAAIDAHLKIGFKPRGQKVLTHDPSDSGDPKAYVYRHGNVILAAEDDTTHDVNDGCDWALDQAIARNADVFRWDYDGLGLSLKRQVERSLKDTNIRWDTFNGNGELENKDSIYEPAENGSRYQNKKNKDVFRNPRAQNYWRLRDRFYNTYRRVVKNDGEVSTDSMISISSDIKCLQKMRSEICRIPLKNSGTGLIQIMSKEEMKTKLKIESPNLADCAMMSEANPMKLIKEGYLKPLEYNTKGIV
jgi:phage terminase large subunit